MTKSYIENRSGIEVAVFDVGCRPATDFELELWAELSELRKDRERLNRLHGPMVRFVRLAMRATFDGCDYDGWQMQDDLHRIGLLEEKTMTEPCGEICDCADVDAEFPTQCYRIIPEFLEAEAALNKKVEGEG